IDYSDASSLRVLFFFVVISRRPPTPTLFPYTTLFRSGGLDHLARPRVDLEQVGARPGALGAGVQDLGDEGARAATAFDLLRREDLDHAGFSRGFGDRPSYPRCLSRVRAWRSEHRVGPLRSSPSRRRGSSTRRTPTSTTPPRHWA